MKMGFKKITILTLSIFATCSVFAEILMPRIFSDNMILQRDMPVKIWGKATPDARVGVDFKDQQKMVVADKDGNWVVELKPMSASFDPAELSVLENGQPAKKISNVLVGEVWILGGQSNMQWSLKNTTDYDAAKARANYDALRYFYQPAGTFTREKQFDTPEGSKWIVSNPEVVGGWSGVGFYFAEQLFKDINVPVAIVETSLGGSSMRAWMPEESFAGIPFLEEKKAEFDKQLQSYDYEKAYADWKERNAKYEELVKQAKADGKAEPAKPQDVKTVPNKTSPQRPQETPSWLFNGKVAPIAGYTARGIIWYQGESDGWGKPVEVFDDQFVRLIQSWRKAWGNDDMYFGWVQLASFGNASSWGLARWKQYQTMRKLPKTGMANIIDTGEEKDIHPKDKTTVGTRLEKIVLRDVYGAKGISPYGPMFKTVKYTNKGAEIVFELDGRKLVGKGDPRGFEVKIGEEWKPAKAELIGRRVIVNPDGEDKGKSIDGVRYLWKGWALPDVWLYNDQGLPALSFISEK